MGKNKYASYEIIAVRWNEETMGMYSENGIKCPKCGARFIYGGARLYYFTGTVHSTACDKCESVHIYYNDFNDLVQVKEKMTVNNEFVQKVAKLRKIIKKHFSHLNIKLKISKHRGTKVCYIVSKKSAYIPLIDDAVSFLEKYDIGHTVFGSVEVYKGWIWPDKIKQLIKAVEIDLHVAATKVMVVESSDGIIRMV